VRPEDVVMQGHVLGALQVLQTQAQAHLTQALECVQQASARQAATLHQFKRVELQLKKLAEHRERLLREQDEQQQDLQDEESEEAAQARGLGQRRDLARHVHAQARAAAAAAAKGAP
jgi:GAF domain-containing protein